MSALDDQLLAAHIAGDCDALIALYSRAADQAESDEARGFFLTHAHVFALEAGDARAHDLRAALIAMGRESPL